MSGTTCFCDMYLFEESVARAAKDTGMRAVVGEVLALRAYWNGTLPFCREREAGWSDFEYRVRNWINYCWTSGDNIVEQHVHNIDVVNWAFKDVIPEQVHGVGGSDGQPRRRQGDVDARAARPGTSGP